MVNQFVIGVILANNQITTQYKYIQFELVKQKPKTLVYDILNSQSLDKIGTIKWYTNWRQYVFFPVDECIFSIGCLNDIIDFTKKVQNNHKELRNKI